MNYRIMVYFWTSWSDPFSAWFPPLCRRNTTGRNSFLIDISTLIIGFIFFSFNRNRRLIKRLTVPIMTGCTHRRLAPLQLTNINQNREEEEETFELLQSRSFCLFVRQYSLWLLVQHLKSITNGGNFNTRP